MLNNNIFKDPGETSFFRFKKKKEKIQEDKLIERNLEELAKEVLYQFGQRNIKFIIVQGNVHNYILFRSKIINSLQDKPVFIYNLNGFSPEQINGQYKDSKIIVYDPLKKSSPILNKVFILNLETILRLEKFVYSESRIYN